MACRTAAIAAFTSSNVSGHPPAPPTLRYSMFATRKPSVHKSSAIGAVSSALRASRQKPPWMTWTRAAAGSSGSRMSRYWLG
ncbi:Uncharacterised protein [Mycobacteroides abscessus subsp. abscessus]|nr:Uncharacterised protein [Mycobacteroides abscessus subsp. abscessus]